MYYLQSRYYNPDWGRFINADAVVGQTGELLGHNMFAYCANNPVNMQDPNGYRYSIIDGGVQDDIFMGRANRIPPPSPLKKDVVINTLTGALPSAIDSGTACGMAQIANPLRKITIEQQALPRGGISVEYTTYVKSKPLLSAASKGYKYLGGTATIVSFGYNVWDDIHHNHSAERIAIDAGGVALGVVAGLLLAPLGLSAGVAIGISAFVGFGIGMGTTEIKRRMYGD